MARNYKAGLVITGDSSGGVKAVKLTRKELEALNDTQKKGKASSKDYGAQIADLTGKMAKYAALVGGAAVAAGAALVKQNLAQIDSLAKTADKLGVTTEALGQLRYAAELTGVSSGTLDTALQRMTRRIAEAAQGTGTAKDAIKELGLNAETLAKQSPDKAFKSIADAMQNANSKSDRLRLAFKLFDTEGAALVNTLDGGSASLNAMAAEADALGISVSRIDAAKIEQANDSMTRANGLLSSFGKQLTIAVAPVLEAVVTDLTNAGKEAGGFGSVATKAFDYVLKGIGVMANGLHGIKILFQALKAAGLGLGVAVLGVFDQMGRKGAEIANLFGADIDYDSTSFSKFVAELEEDFREATDKIHDMAMEELPSYQIERYVEKAREASEETAKATAKAKADAIQKTAEATESGLVKIEKVKKQADPFAKAWEEATKRIDQSFADAWKGAFDSFSSFADSIKDAFKNLLAELAHQAVTKPILVSLGLGGNTGGGLFSSLLGGGSGSGAGGSGGGLFSGVSTAWNAVKTGLGITAFYNAATTASAQGAGFWGAIDSGLGGIYNGGAAAGETVAPLTYQLQNQYGEQISAIGEFAKKAGPWVAAIGGAISGYEQRGWSSAASGAAGAYGGYQLGATYGSTFGPIGTVVGAALGALLGGSVGGRLFGTGWQTKNTGFALGIDDGELDGKTYENRKKDKSFFRGTKRRTNIEALDAETAGILTSGIDATKATIQDYFATLGMTVEDSVLDAFSLAPTQINLSGLSDEEVGEAIDEWFGTVADGMTRAAQGAGKTAKELAVDLIKDATEWDQAKKDSILYRQDKLAEYTRRAGLTDETPDFDGIQTFDRLRELVTALTSVNGVLEVINGTLLDSSIVGAEVAESMIQMYGGLDGFQASISTFYDLFFTDAEKFDDLSNSLAGTLEAMGLSIPDTREAFKQLVQETDNMTEAGRLQFAALLDLAPAMDQYYSYLEGLPPVVDDAADSINDLTPAVEDLGEAASRTADEIRDAARSIISSAASNLYQSVDAERSSIQSQYDSYVSEAQARITAIRDDMNSAVSGYSSSLSKVNSEVSRLASLAGYLGDQINDIQVKSGVNESLAARRAAQQVLFNQALSGSVNESALKSAVSVLRGSTKGLFSSKLDEQRESARTRGALQLIKGSVETDQAAAQRRTGSIVAAITRTETKAQAQIDLIEEGLEIAEREYLDEMQRLDDLVASTESQVNALLGIDDSVDSVADAVLTLAGAIAAMGAEAVTGVEGESFQGFADSVTSDGSLTREEGLQAYAIAKSLGVSMDDAASALGITREDVDRFLRKENLPAFASGGYHSGGWRVVGEREPEIEFTGPSTILNRRNLMDSISTDGVVRELQSLKEEMAAQNADLTYFMQVTAEVLERWEEIGQPEVRV